MSSVFYGYFKKVKHAQPLLWGLNAPAPLGAKIASFVCLGVGLGMASQIPPKVQLPVEFVGGNDDGGVDNNDNSPIATSSASVAAGPPLPATAIETEQTEKSGWKVRCPFDFTDNKDTSNPVHGLERITRHPGLWSFGLIGLGNALLIPSIPQRAWLAMPAMVALIGGAHTDSRFRRGMGGSLSKEYDEATSNVPFVALLTGAQGNVLDVMKDFSGEVKPLNAAIALGVSGLWVMRRGRGVKVPSILR